MENYMNLSGKSGVIAYEIGGDFIKVKFRGGSIYTYTYKISGCIQVDTMKHLAESGEGLSTFISREVKKNYAAKE